MAPLGLAGQPWNSQSYGHTVADNSTVGNSADVPAVSPEGTNIEVTNAR
ncbi:MAG: hypothetical protein K0U78_01825 [Actinomycetia bacterium]|nr:hypothetical protein [Actinomycetes bacterium]